MRGPVGPAHAFDLLVVGGDVVDGTGRPRVRADVGVADGRIVEVGNLGGAAGRAREVIDATGLVLAPGFIDVHVHSELALLGDTGDATADLLQGVTTNLTGPDGFGFAGVTAGRAREIEVLVRFVHGRVPGLAFDWPTPDAYLRAFEGHIPINVAAQAPHLPIRVGAMGWEARRARADEVEAMARATRAWMEAGAVGLATGLDYQPICHSGTDELVALARVAAEYGGAYSAHGRHIEGGREGAFSETVEVGRRAGVRAHVAHEHVDEAFGTWLRRDPDVTSDSHLYEAGSTHLAYYLPFEDQVGGPAAALERLSSPAYRRDLTVRLDASLEPVALNAWFSASRTGRHIGRTLAEIANERHPGAPAGATIVELLREELPDALMVYPWGPTETEFRPNVIRTLQHPRVMVSSDGVYQGPLPHPRGFGTFPRAIRVGVRELQAVTLEEAVNRMTALPAARYGLADRGLIEVGRAADLVVFDPGTIADRATYAEPRLAPVGIESVIVNGRVAARDGQVVDARAGRVLRRT